MITISSLCNWAQLGTSEFLYRACAIVYTYSKAARNTTQRQVESQTEMKPGVLRWYTYIYSTYLCRKWLRCLWYSYHCCWLLTTICDFRVLVYLQFALFNVHTWTHLPPHVWIYHLSTFNFLYCWLVCLQNKIKALPNWMVTTI